LSTRGKIIPAKKMKPPCQCRRQCYKKINENERLVIFNNFYNLQLKSQNQYISSSVEEYPKNTLRVRQNNNPSRRLFSKKII